MANLWEGPRPVLAWLVDSRVLDDERGWRGFSQRRLYRDSSHV